MKLKLIILMLLLISAPLQAIEAPGLKMIMVKLGQDLTLLQSSLMIEDYPAAIAAAQRIADHEKAPMVERKQIVKFLGKRAATFKAWDIQVHNAGNKVVTSLQANKHIDAEKAYLTILQGCLGCHRDFREEIKNH